MIALQFLEKVFNGQNVLVPAEAENSNGDTTKLSWLLLCCPLLSGWLRLVSSGLSLCLFSYLQFLCLIVCALLVSVLLVLLLIIIFNWP